ncbi:ankyrin [Thozetella sp. PMI_491]|nr:ankyrin [Thozetella sp. PMI_491]
MSTILDLPTEVTRAIASFLKTRDQLSLAKTNHRLYRMALPVLYDEDTEAGFGYALAWASYHGNVNTLRWALNAGADVNAPGPRPRGRLRWIKSCRKAKAIASPGMWHKGSYMGKGHVQLASPLHWAAMGGHEAVALVLLDHGADIDAPSHKACDCTVLPGSAQPSWRDRMILMEDPTELKHVRWTPLHSAICSKSVAMARLLIEHGAYPIVGEGDMEVTAMQSAASKGLLEVMKLLSEKYGNAMACYDGRHRVSPLHYALQSLDVDIQMAPSIVRALHGMGADILSSGGRSCITPLECACYFSKYTAALALLDLGAGLDEHVGRIYFGGNPLHWCAMEVVPPMTSEQFQEELIVRLLEAGVNPEEWCASLYGSITQGYTPLLIAVKRGREELALKFLRAGVNPDTHSSQGHRPLELALNIKSENLTKALLAAGASPNRTAGRQFIPLISAAARSHAITKILLEHGATVDAEDANQNTALMAALEHGKLDTVRLLLRAGANPRHVNKQGKDIVHAAHRCQPENQEELIELLVEYGLPRSEVGSLATTETTELDTLLLEGFDNLLG